MGLFEESVDLALKVCPQGMGWGWGWGGGGGGQREFLVRGVYITGKLMHSSPVEDEDKRVASLPSPCFIPLHKVSVCVAGDEAIKRVQ